MTAETVESNGSARRFLSVAQVAAELTLAPNTVRGWLLERRLPSIVAQQISEWAGTNRPTISVAL